GACTRLPLSNPVERLVVEADQWQEPRLAGIAGNGRPLDTLHRIAVLAAEHGIGHDHAEMGGKLRAVAGIAHRVPDPVIVAGPREPVLGPVYAPAQAI